MSSMWASALASLDDSLAALDMSLQQLEAARPIELPQVIERLKVALESSEHVRAVVLSKSPDTEWDNRDELDMVLEDIDVEHRRSRLRGLATELEHGSIVHRRAARVAQLTELRSQAMDELRSLAEAKKAPPQLPGPEADRWIEWACNLKEPEDTASLQNLRAGFAGLDEFVASLEPGMWVSTSVQTSSATETTPPQASVDAKEAEQLRARILALASELERGEVVHHRAMRVTQVNQLREQAVQELRFQAVVARMPAPLPGPEAEQWVQWAFGLKEPEDSQDLQLLRESYAHLDEFVANLEPGMWVPSGSRPVAAAAAAGAAAAGVAVTVAHEAAPQAQEPVRAQVAYREESRTTVRPEKETPAETPAFANLITPDEGESSRLSVQVMPRLAELWRAKWRVLLPGIVLLLALLGAMQWRLHRTHASDNVVKATEAPATGAAESGPNGSTTNAPTSAAAATPDVTEKGAKPKDVAAGARTATPPPPAPVKEASLLNDSGLRTPQAIPKTVATASGEAPSGAAEQPGVVPGAVPGGVPSNVTNVAKDVPLASPRLSTQKIRVSSGVAQGQLIHQVTPSYPNEARQSGVHGTVVLQAVVGKDGKVQDVRALSGPPMLVKSAVDAVKQWRYRPFTVNGEAAEADVEINVKFAQ
jgi:periplasmic protein TonB